MLFGADQVKNRHLLAKKTPSRLWDYNQLKMVSVAKLYLFFIHTGPGVHGFRRVSRTEITSWNSMVAAHYPRGDGLWLILAVS